jgi:thiamine biosynthesis lipoprotein ApbE
MQEIENPPASVTVISPNCVESGVYSTALMRDPSLKTKHRTIIL